MNDSLRALGKRAEALSPPQLEVAALVAAGESRIRRRRHAAVAAVTAAVVAVVGAAALVSPGARNGASAPARPDQKTTDHKSTDTVQTRALARQLTYTVGTKIHWGTRTIDVDQQIPPEPKGARRTVGYVDATDNGAVFVVGMPAVIEQGELGLPSGPAGVWFTDGSAPVRIGTTSGSRVRGFEIAPTAAGSTLAWIDPGTTNRAGGIVVYDTEGMEELARLGDKDAVPLAVYDDVVYWSPDRPVCTRYLPSGAGYGCEPPARVMRFETASGLQSSVSTADYDADRRARPGLLTGRSHDPLIRRGVPFLSFVRHGARLVAVGTWEIAEPGFPATVALTGQPLHLRHPAKNPRRQAGDDSHILQMVQWLDPDRVVLLDDFYEDLVTCRLSTGHCRVTLSIRNRNFNAAGPVPSHG